MSNEARPEEPITALTKRLIKYFEKPEMPKEGREGLLHALGRLAKEAPGEFVNVSAFLLMTAISDEPIYRSVREVARSILANQIVPEVTKRLNSAEACRNYGEAFVSFCAASGSVPKENRARENVLKFIKKYASFYPELSPKVIAVMTEIGNLEPIETGRCIGMIPRLYKELQDLALEKTHNNWADLKWPYWGNVPFQVEFHDDSEVKVADHHQIYRDLLIKSRDENFAWDIIQINTAAGSVLVGNPNSPEAKTVLVLISLLNYTVSYLNSIWPGLK